MLQQTQVATVVPFYERWMKRFPSLTSLAAASHEEALSMWAGLGYYRRCRQLVGAAKQIVHRGTPQSASEWRALPGVGAYAAGAIASIAFDEPTPAVDGNVRRVFARLEGCELKESALQNAAWDWARKTMPEFRPGDWNQALMELGATVCIPRLPKCSHCPLNELCVAYSTQRVHELPKTPARPATVNLKHAIWVPRNEGRFGVLTVPAGEWWEHMWSFPRADMAKPDAECKLRALVGDGCAKPVGTFVHSVTSHRIAATVVSVRCDTQSPSLAWRSPAELEDAPLPAPMRKALSMVQSE